MDTTRAKFSVGIKLVLVFTGLLVALFISLVAWYCFRESHDFMGLDSPAKLAANSQLVILARFDTNVPVGFVVTEIWKQPKNTSDYSAKVGAKLPIVWAKEASSMPDGAVIFYHQQRSLIPLIEPETNNLVQWNEYFIWQGRVNYMTEQGAKTVTVQEFKVACGL